MPSEKDNWKFNIQETKSNLKRRVAVSFCNHQALPEVVSFDDEARERVIGRLLQRLSTVFNNFYHL